MRVTEEMKRDFANDGAIVVRGLFSPDQMKRIYECFEYGLAHPGPLAVRFFKGTDDEHFNDACHWENADQYAALSRELGLHNFMASLWDSKNVWFYNEELFVKTGGKAGRSPWHQDTSYFPVSGDHLANIWISFESLPKENALEIVRGSHRGVKYDGASYTDPSDPTRPLWGGSHFPRLPDIEADRRKDSASWEVLSWAMEPGDAIVFHSSTLHGGAPVTPRCPTRHTLVLRFFGDKLFYRPRPDTNADYPANIRRHENEPMTPGAPYRGYCKQLR